MQSITLVLAKTPNGQMQVTPIRNDVPPRLAAEACRIAAAQLLEEAIRAEVEEEREQVEVGDDA